MADRVRELLVTARNTLSRMEQEATREVLVLIRDNLFRLAEEAAQDVRDFDHLLDPPLFTAPYLTEAAEAEARGEDEYERGLAGA